MDEKPYYSIPVFPVKQFQDLFVLVGKIKFSQLRNIARLVARKAESIDPLSEQKPDENRFYQRSLTQSRVNAIYNFLLDELIKKYQKKDSIGLFPTSMILALELNEMSEEYQNNPTKEVVSALSKDDIKDFFAMDNESAIFDKVASKLYIPNTKEITFIVDGQHRFAGIQKLFERVEQDAIDLDKYGIKDKEDCLKFMKESVESFEFITTILLDWDMYLQGKIFATVNFEQKPVNKSFYYDIFGSLPDPEKNDLKLAHLIISHLNANPESPLKDMVRMLGTGWGLISQAFFVESILPYFKKGRIWEYIYADYLREQEEYIKILTFLRAYFRAIEKQFNFAWPKRDERNIYSLWKYHNILCKTTGMASMLLLINDIYPLVKNFNNEKEIGEQVLAFFRKIPDDKAHEIFDKYGEFGRTGGKGLQTDLYRTLKGMIFQSKLR